jgi:hypothetical protein
VFREHCSDLGSFLFRTLYPNRCFSVYDFIVKYIFACHTPLSPLKLCIHSSLYAIFVVSLGRTYCFAYFILMVNQSFHVSFPSIAQKKRIVRKFPLLMYVPKSGSNPFNEIYNKDTQYYISFRVCILYMFLQFYIISFIFC